MSDPHLSLLMPLDRPSLFASSPPQPSVPKALPPSLCGEVTKPGEVELSALPELLSQGWGTVSSNLLRQT